MKSKQANKGYDYSAKDVKPYSANPRTGARIENPERSDARNAAAEKQRNSHAGAGYREMQLDVANRQAARQASAGQEEKKKLQARGRH